MEFRILGPLEVLDGGTAVPLPSGEAKLLFAALLVDARRVVSTDRLYEVLWNSRRRRQRTPCRPTSTTFAMPSRPAAPGASPVASWS